MKFSTLFSSFFLKRSNTPSIIKEILNEWFFYIINLSLNYYQYVIIYTLGMLMLKKKLMQTSHTYCTWKCNVNKRSRKKKHLRRCQQLKKKSNFNNKFVCTNMFIYHNLLLTKIECSTSVKMFYQKNVNYATFL